jgi:hypothetical protein
MAAGGLFLSCVISREACYNFVMMWPGDTHGWEHVGSPVMTEGWQTAMDAQLRDLYLWYRYCQGFSRHYSTGTITKQTLNDRSSQSLDVVWCHWDSASATHSQCMYISTCVALEDTDVT